ncbi:hypothetical protein RND71_040017 [Anisodus tanguticus]|uniref:Uncharacterized protein n=1 Tax=Anisodus tanguticus TaxID=243964 RepID=A0AAE1UVW2_9SOLA|nr:hypothetical protein RND71_040017 [Anisodus tanguticus]
MTDFQNLLQNLCSNRYLKINFGVKKCDETGNDDNLKKSESKLFEEKDGVGIEVNGEEVDKFGVKKCDENERVCKIGIESNVSIPKSNSAEGVKAVSSISYRRLLPFLMDVAKNDPGGALSDPKFQKDLDCNRRLMSMISSSAAESFSKTPSSVFPDDVPNSQTLLNVEIKRKSETENTDISNTEKSEPECLNNVSRETSAGEYDVAIPNLLPISLEDFPSEYGVEDPKVEPVSPEADHTNLEVDCNEENRNAGDPTGTVEIHADAKLLMRF